MNRNEGSDPNGNGKHEQDAVDGSISRLQDSDVPESSGTQLQTDDGAAGAEQGVEQCGQSDPAVDGSTQQITTRSGMQLAAFTHSGPLPPVSEFAGYEQTLPGAADRILIMAEKSLDMEIADRQREGESKRANQNDENWAMKVAAFGFTFLPWLGFISAIACAAFGQQTATWVSVLIGAISAGPQIINSVKHSKK